MIPYIEVAGDAKKIGEAIGEHLRDDIVVALQRFEKRFKHTPRLWAWKKKLASIAKKFFPEYIKELQGIADGARQPFDRFLSFSFEEELAYHDSCSTLAINIGHTVLFGHNEDWDHPMPLYVSTAKPKKGPRFLSVSYAGQLPGMSATINDAGFVYSANSIATPFHNNGLPKIYCLRGLATARSLDQALNIISAHDRSSGNSSVIVFKKQLYILEWSPTKIALERCVPWVAHANRFILPEMKNEQSSASRGSTSDKRLAHMWDWFVCTPRVTAQEMKNVLSDHSDPKHSLCRHNKDDQTVASVVIDTEKKEMQVAYGQPCISPFQKFWL